jgi:hypothetical protein
MDGAANPCKMVVSQLTNLAAVIKDVDRKVRLKAKGTVRPYWMCVRVVSLDRP